MWISWLYLFLPGIIRCHVSFYKKEKRGEMERGKCFRLAFAFFQAQLFSCQGLLFTNEEKKMHYCKPDGNIPHDQTNQSPWWDAGVTQPRSNTPFHSLSGTNTWSPINGTPRTHEKGCSSTAALVHGWWLHNHTSILSKEKCDELPKNVSHHVNPNTVMGAASVGRLTRSLPSHGHMWAFCHCWNKSTFNKQKKWPPVLEDIEIISVCNIKVFFGCLVLDAKQLLNSETESRGEGQGRIHTWVRNADPAPSTGGIFPHAENPEQSSV